LWYLIRIVLAAMAGTITATIMGLRGMRELCRVRLPLLNATSGAHLCAATV
jgi:hypothetical protein